MTDPGEPSDGAALGGAAGAGGSDPVAVLLDLPVPLWSELLRALRRAVDRLPRAELPATLRPYAGWTPERLADDRPRAAIAQALAADPRLREEVGAAMESSEVVDAAAAADGSRLAETHGEGKAVAALVTHGRWDDLAVVAAEAVQRRVGRDRSAREAARLRETEELEATHRRLTADLAEARRERDVQRRRASAAEERARRDDASHRDQLARIDRLRERVDELEQQLVEERRQRDRRVARLQRRLEESEARARVDHTRAERVVSELERLAAELRAAMEPTGPARPDAGDGPLVVGAVPRSMPAATPGRPCRLPPGVRDDEPGAVRALLQVDGLETVLDGYNVTKDVRGRPHVGLAEQRQWLVKVVGGLVARYGRRFTVVFDGTDERAGPGLSARGVRVVFTTGEEIADERISAIVEALGPAVPVLVVSSDREVRDAAAAMGANVASSGSFLTATGA